MQNTFIGFLTALALVSVCSQVNSQDYIIKRQSEGPFSDKIGGQLFNDGSSLERENIILNDPSCPVQILSNSMSIDKPKISRRYLSSTALQFEKKVMAVLLTHAIHDVFGRFIENLGYIEIRDFGRGTATFSGIWEAKYQTVFGRDRHKQLTTVTFVSGVRLEGATQWLFDQEKLFSTLSSLHLQGKITGEYEQEKSEIFDRYRRIR